MKNKFRFIILESVKSATKVPKGRKSESLAKRALHIESVKSVKSAIIVLKSVKMYQSIKALNSVFMYLYYLFKFDIRTFINIRCIFDIFDTLVVMSLINNIIISFESATKVPKVPNRNVLTYE
jgi:hypothetical protein